MDNFFDKRRCGWRSPKASFLVCMLLLAGSAWAGQQGNGFHLPQPPDSPRVLYNGIRLPETWPPQTEDPASPMPMRVPYLETPPAFIPIHTGRQLFVDDFLVEKTDLNRVYHQAQKYHGNPVFYPATPNELAPHSGYSATTYLGQGGVFFDPGESRFKMFYTAGWRGGLALATSKDLINWTRPSLGLQKGNIIIPRGPLMAGGDNAVYLDLYTNDSAQRYKMITERLVDGAWAQHFDKRSDLPTHTLHFSADGRIWSQGVPAGRASDYCSFFYNPFRNVWVYSIKQNTRRGRARYYAESSDFIRGARWDKKVYWVGADTLDKPDPGVGDTPQLYSLNAVAYESIMLGEFYIHLGPHNKIAEAGKFPKITELHLGYSRDGFHWHRPDRKPFIPATRKEGDWDRAYLHGNTGVCVVMGDKIWFPYCAYSGVAPDGSRGMYNGASIGLAFLRRDGFASMEAGARKGTLLTRPLTFNGQYFFVNVDCPQGELRVEVLDEKGRVIDPFSARNCVPVKTDKTLQAVTWKGAADISSLKNRIVRFRFHLTNGKLYSFWVSPDTSGASYGFVGSGGPGFDGVTDNKGINAYQEKAKENDPGLAPSVINTSPLPGYDYDRLDYGMNMGMERTPSGRLWACWTAGGDDPDSFIVLASSNDNGDTWSKPLAAVDAHDPALGEKRSVQNGNLWTDPLGRLWLFFDQSMTDFDGRAGIWYSVCENPDSKEPVWSAPRRIWHGTAKSKPIVLSGGEWVLPVSLLNRDIIDKSPGKYLDAYHELDSLRMAHLFISTDQGKTWHRQGGVRFPNASFDEHHIIERRDGSLWMTARTNDGIWESSSSDKGKTWSQPAKYMEHTSSRHFIRRLQSGRLILVKHGEISECTKTRSKLMAFLSDDDGKTWKGGLMLDERRGVSYPDGFQAPDGTLFISYDRNRATDGLILMSRFTENDVLAGSFQSKNSAKRILISKPEGLDKLPAPSEIANSK